MRTIMRSMYKNWFTNGLYVLLLCIAFTAISLLAGLFLGRQRLMVPFVALLNTLPLDSFEAIFTYNHIWDIQRMIQSVLASLMWVAVIIIMLCIFALPLLPFLSGVGRVYELGVMRALGLGKTRAWLYLFAESAVITVAALLVSQAIAWLTYERFVLAVLGIDAETQSTLSDAFVDGRQITDYIYLQGAAIAATAVLALLLLCIVLVLYHSLVGRSAPLQLMRDNK